MMFWNSRDLPQTARGAHADLVRLSLTRGRVADAAGGDLNVLLAQRIDDVAGGQLARGQLGRVEPEAHRVLAFAEDHDVADAGKALERVLHVDVDVVAHEERVVSAGLAVHASAEHEVRRLFLDGDAGRPHLGRHASDRLVDAILDVDRGEIDVTGHVEGDVDLADAGVRARRGHVEHALDAVNRLLERCRDCGFDRLGVGAGVERRHA